MADMCYHFPAFAGATRCAVEKTIVGDRLGCGTFLSVFSSAVEHRPHKTEHLGSNPRARTI